MTRSLPIQGASSRTWTRWDPPLRRQCGAALRPETVYFVGDLPRTRNAKIMRRVVRAAFLGLPAGDTTALENPTAAEAIAALRGGQGSAGTMGDGSA